MKKLIGLIIVLVAFAFAADVKPFVFTNIPTDSATQQEQFNYMLMYKLFGHDFIKIGNDVVIPDESGWNGTAGDITSNARLTLGGPILVNGTFTMGDGQNIISGPVRTKNLNMGNVNNSQIASPVCLSGTANSNALTAIEGHTTYNFDAQICKDSVPAAPVNLEIPTIDWDNLNEDIKLDDIIQTNNGVEYTIDVPPGDKPYKVLVDKIHMCEGGFNQCKIYVKMPDGGRLTEIFVKDFKYGRQSTIQVVYKTDTADVILSQGQYRGNLLIYTNSVLSFDNTDNYPIMGTFISTDSIFLGRNINIAGQLISTKLEIGNTLDGKSFRFVKFDPDTIDVKLDKYGGLRENDSTVVIPIELSDTSDIKVSFKYCFDLKDGVTVDDFNIPPSFPICGKDEPIKVIIPIGSKVPSDPIKVNVKIDTLTELNDYLVIKIDSISGAILPDGKTDGELKIKIIDAETNHKVHFDTTKTYSVNENYTGTVEDIAVIGKTDSTRFILDSAARGTYTLDPVTGTLVLTIPLDFEAVPIDTIKVTVKDGSGYAETRYIPIKVKDVNEAPVLNDTTFVLTENIPVPAIIGTLVAKDEDQVSDFRQNVFTIIDGSDLFAIDQGGRITTTKIFNYEFDDTVYTLKVLVYDKTDPSLKDSATVTIKIGDTNEGPKFNSNDTTLYIPENTEPGIIGKVEATDDDGDSITYKIVDTVPFVVDSVGNISSTREFDYEKEKEFVFNVVASDGTLTDTIKVIVKIQNVNEPVHVNDTTLTVPENYTGPIGKIEGVDDDGEPVKYSVRDSNDYSIDSLGRITVINPLDYETAEFDTLIVDVTTPSGDRDSAIVIIKVQNVNEDPKLLPNDSLTVPENCKNCIVGIITAVDPDGDTITYTVKEPGFTIDSTGVLKLTEPLDYEDSDKVTITVIASDPHGGADTATYVIKVTDINEPVHVKDTTCSVKENYTGKVCQIIATDEDKTTPIFIITDTTNYSIDSTGVITIKNPLDFEKTPKDTVTVIVTDGEFYDTARVIINVLDEPEKVEITEWDDKTPPDTVKTNEPDHHFEWKLCEGDSCIYSEDFPHIRKDTVIKVCNDKKTVCDSVVVLFNDAPPVVTLKNTKSTDAYIDYITIEEQKDSQIYVNKKNNDLTVFVEDTVRHTKKSFDIGVKLDTVHISTSVVKDFQYLIDESKAEIKSIGNGLSEMTEVIKDGNTYVTITKIVRTDTHESVDTVQTVSYKVKQDGKEVTISYKTDNLTGQRIGDYNVSYNIDSCTTVSYSLGDNKKIVKNDEGNIAYTISYDYTDDFGNKATASVDIIFDDIPPVVEILDPIENNSYNTNAIAVKWMVNGEVQDTLTLQRLEKGVNRIIRRYVDKAGNVSADTVLVIMREAKDIDISIVYSVTEIDKDKVDSFYSEGNKYDKKNPYTVTVLKGDDKPDPLGVGFKVDIALPSVSPTGGLATLDDLVKNGMIPVDDRGNITGASTKGIPVDEYVENHCTDEFIKDYRKNGLNIPLYDVTYKLHLWVYTTQASYVNDFSMEYTLNNEDEVTSAGTVALVVDYIADKDGHVKAKNGHALGTSSYITKLFSKSIAKHRCDYKTQVKGDKTVKKDEDLTIFGYKRPNK